MQIPAWQYHEPSHPGADFDAIAESYDKNMQTFRDVQGEIDEVLAYLDLKPEESVLEMGTGTGEFALAAARRCRQVYAVDLSEGMLRYAQKKARARGVANVVFLQGGFLSYNHGGEPLDAVVSQLALHHLPDFWKQIALLRLSGMLRKGGRLCLRDVVYSFDPSEYESFFEGLIGRESRNMKGSTGLSDSLINHVKNEYSTMDWIMRGMMERAGFHIEKADLNNGFIALYLCKKV